MKRRRTAALLAAVFVLAVPLSACGRKAESSAVEVVPVLAAKVEKKAVPIELSAIGNVEALQTVAVQARVAGEIDQVAFSEGQDVQPGDLLFTIDPRPYQAALAEAQARARARPRARQERRGNRGALRRSRQEGLRHGRAVRADARRRGSGAGDGPGGRGRGRKRAPATLLHEDHGADLGAHGEHPGSQGQHAAAQRRTDARDDQPDPSDLGHIHGSRVGLRRDPPRPGGGQALGRGAALARLARLEPADAGAAAEAPVTAAASPETGELSFVDNAVDRATGTVRSRRPSPTRPEPLAGPFVDVVLRWPTIPARSSSRPRPSRRASRAPTSSSSRTTRRSSRAR